MRQISAARTKTIIIETVSVRAKGARQGRGREETSGLLKQGQAIGLRPARSHAIAVCLKRFIDSGASAFSLLASQISLTVPPTKVMALLQARQIITVVCRAFPSCLPATDARVPIKALTDISLTRRTQT